MVEKIDIGLMDDNVFDTQASSIRTHADLEDMANQVEMVHALLTLTGGSPTAPPPADNDVLFQGNLVKYARTSPAKNLIRAFIKQNPCVTYRSGRITVDMDREILTLLIQSTNDFKDWLYRGVFQHQQDIFEEAVRYPTLENMRARCSLDDIMFRFWTCGMDDHKTAEVPTRWEFFWLYDSCEDGRNRLLNILLGTEDKEFLVAFDHFCFVGEVVVVRQKL